MANKKSAATKSANKKTFLEKASDKVSHIKDDLISGKDHLAEIAKEAFVSVKSGIQHFTKKKKTAKKAVKKSAKKIAPKKAKAAVKKTAKPALKKGSDASIKKSAKKAATKKVAKKK